MIIVKGERGGSSIFWKRLFLSSVPRVGRQRGGGGGLGRAPGKKRRESDAPKLEWRPYVSWNRRGGAEEQRQLDEYQEGRGSVGRKGPANIA